MSSDHPNGQCGSFCSFLGQNLEEFMAHMLAHTLTPSDSTGPSNCNPINVANVKAPTTRPEKSTNPNLSSLDPATEDKQNTKIWPNQNKFSCDKCSFKAQTASSLRAHSRFHWSEKPFKCSNVGCNYETRWAGALRTHRCCGGQIPIPTAQTSDEVSIVAVVDKSGRSEGTTEFSIEKAELTEGEPFLYGCLECSHIAYGKESLQRHLLVHKRRKSYFRSDSQHLSQNSASSASQCDTKNVDRFRAPRPKSTIRRSHPETSPLSKIDFRCGSCSMTFGNKGELLQHPKNICPRELLLCEKCGYRTSFAQNLRKHMRIHLAGRQLKCRHLGCDYTTLWVQSLIKHQRSCKIAITAPETSGGISKSIDILTEAVKIIEGKTEYSCSFCSFKSKSRSLLKRHYRTHVGRKTWRCGCKECKYEAKSSQKLWRHIRRDHSRKVPLQTEENLGLDMECEIRTEEATTVKIHNESQNSLGNSTAEESKLTPYRTPDHPDKAPKGPLQTKENSGLLKECEVNTEERSAKMCNDSPNSLENSTAEESKLTLTKNDCESKNPDTVQNETVVEVKRRMLRSGSHSFTNLYPKNLRTRRRIQSSEKQFKCPHLGCAFMTRWALSLRHHQRSCPDRIPIPAQTFDQAAVDKIKTEGTTETLMEKEKAIDGETLFYCSLCSFKSKWKPSLKAHLRIHVDNQPFRCPIEGCKYLTEFSSELRKHLRILHHFQVPAKAPVQTDDKLRSEREMKIQGFVSTVGFACVLCEFIGFSALSALKHSCEHKTAVISLDCI